MTWRITELTVKISYDDQGFDLDVNHSLIGQSLSIMRERASEVEGQVWVTCSEATGTEIVLRLPLQLVDWLSELKSLHNHGINRNCQAAG